ncbi:MAG: Bro-N domain-containing protein [Microgenomates group bacterium]
MDEQRTAIFKQKSIRKIIYKNEWWFVINDVILALTDSSDPAQYFKRIRTRDGELASLISKGGVHFVPPLMLKIKSTGGIQLMYCWNTEGIFRLIQSIPSPKAEPFKRWLAKVGYERVQEIDDPELAQKRARAIYKAKGYPDDWIDLRMRGIMIREKLTDEWEHHSVKGGREYEILTAEISKATFGMTPSEYKKFKGLKSQNLRDHMNILESLFSQLGEAATTEITQAENPQGFLPNKSVAQKGGRIAGEAREKLEAQTGRKVSTAKNYLPHNKHKELK